MTDARRFAPATERNRAPLLEVLRRTLPSAGDVLEVASGTGEHAVYFAAALPALRFWPTDPAHESLASIDAWRTHAALANVMPARALDVRDASWPLERCDALLCVNMIHIAPWACTEALFHGARARLPAGAPLVTYGPYRRGGAHTAPSNEAFDAQLRERNPAWGVRDIEAVTGVAEEAGFALAEVIEMPANNLTLCFRRRTLSP